MELTIKPCTGAAIAPYLADLARLRIEVFRDFPYLYEGTMAYEEGYLKGYAAAADHLVVLALDGDNVVGASTAMPLLAHGDDVAAPLAAAGYDPATIFYFGESVLAPAYRGRGVGHAFFDERERFGRARGFLRAAFCAVERPNDHPLRPPAYAPLDAFWQRRGYVRHPDVRTSFTWQDIDEAAPSAKPMVFWTKAL
ncbi:MAG: GNAT family N-acetyltransferase [Myxococcales bacterium]|nr:GNAT family N-acetyltransferase [Myxococcales bacterium]